MPGLLLRQRQPLLREHMDDPDCSREQLEATYQQFSIINQLFAAWRTLYKQYLYPHLTRRPCTLVDIGCGGADVLRQLAYWAAQDNVLLTMTGIDPDTRALSYAAQRALPPNITLRQANSAQLVAEGKQFDFVISNHVLHHLTEAEFVSLCKDSLQLSSCVVLHNDIRRSSLAYAGFWCSRLFFHNSFVAEDGLTSIRRSYTRGELARAAPDGWHVRELLPYRNILVYLA